MAKRSIWNPGFKHILSTSLSLCLPCLIQQRPSRFSWLQPQDFPVANHCKLPRAVGTAFVLLFFICLGQLLLDALRSDGVLSTCRINCAAVVWPEANIGSSSRRDSCHATDRYDGATGDLSTCNSKHCWRRVDVNGGVADRQQHKISR